MAANAAAEPLHAGTQVEPTRSTGVLQFNSATPTEDGGDDLEIKEAGTGELQIGAGD